MSFLCILLIKLAFGLLVANPFMGDLSILGFHFIVEISFYVWHDFYPFV